MLLNDLSKKNLIHPPKWLPANTVLLMVMGSQAGRAGKRQDRR